MNNLIKINDQELRVKEFRGQRVVTFKDIDTLHERVEGTASRNFYENRYKSDGKTEKFIRDEDYFYLTFEEASTTDFVERPNSQGLILITESGYLMLVKTLNDDLAWEVQRQLINNYFRKQVVNEDQIKNIAVNTVSNILDNIVSEKIGEIEAKCAQYYRPAAVHKYHISSYIKQGLGIEVANEEYERVKTRVMIILGAEKWEDIPIETLRASMNVLDECIQAVKNTRNNIQLSFLNQSQY